MISKLRGKKKENPIIEENRAEADDNSPDPRLSKEVNRLLQEGKKFEQNRHDDTRKRLKFMTVGFGCVCAVAICEGVALMAMAPLKTVEPYVIQSDTVSGYTQVARPLKAMQTPDEAMSRFFVSRYVLAREGYDWNEVQSDYDMIQTMSTSRVFEPYSNLMHSDNGPVKVFGDNMRKHAEIRNVTFLDDHTAQVRVAVDVQNANGSKARGYDTRYWLATVSFEYPNGKLTSNQRLVNPMDFKVTAYRIDPEAGK